VFSEPHILVSERRDLVDLPTERVRPRSRATSSTIAGSETAAAFQRRHRLRPGGSVERSKGGCAAPIPPGRGERRGPSNKGGQRGLRRLWASPC
jgi:hypothetical protein